MLNHTALKDFPLLLGRPNLRGGFGRQRRAVHGVVWRGMAFNGVTLHGVVWQYMVRRGRQE
jgi:hypothetical protein